MYLTKELRKKIRSRARRAFALADLGNVDHVTRCYHVKVTEEGRGTLWYRLPKGERDTPSEAVKVRRVVDGRVYVPFEGSGQEVENPYYAATNPVAA